MIKRKKIRIWDHSSNRSCKKEGIFEELKAEVMKEIIAKKLQEEMMKNIWVLVKDKEFFLPFVEFPWFLKATIEQIYDLQLFHNKHLHWPLLDVDIDLESLKNLSLYPLKYS